MFGGGTVFRPYLLIGSKGQGKGRVKEKEQVLEEK